MRNLKRALSLTLASVMLLGMMVVGSSAAAGYDDVSETDNVEAIEVLQTIEVMVGDERGFGPERSVNRAEMAVVMGKLLNLDYNYYTATCPFDDVYDWARGWVGACAANGIVSGRGDGVYDPGATVTAVEAASMLMRALGYFKYQSDYANGFEVSTVLQGNNIGIFDGVGSSATEPMTRNQVAQMVLNALQSGMVQPDGNTLNYFDANGNVIATNGKVNYVYVTSNKAFARSISSVAATSMGSANDAPIVELGEQLYSGNLKLNDSDLDAFGRPARTWEYDGTQIGTYVKKELLRKEFSDKVTGRDLYETLTASTIENYRYRITIDGETRESILNQGDLSYFTPGNLIRANTNAVGATDKGVLTQVYVDTLNEIYYIAIINTYVAKTLEDYNTRDDNIDVTVYGVKKVGASNLLVKDTADTDAGTVGFQARTSNLSPEGEDFPILTEAKKDEVYLVHVAGDEIQEVIKPERLDGVTVSAFKVDSYVVTGGQQYDHADTALYDPEVLEIYTTATGTVNLKDRTYNVILDEYGYLIGLELVEDPDQFVFITGVDGNLSNFRNKEADMNAIFLDGTMKVIKVNVTDSTGGVDRFQSMGAIVNTWCSYTVNNNDVYTLHAVDTALGNNKYGQWAQNAYDTVNVNGVAGANGTYTIDRGHVSLVGGSLARVYGNEETVYINVSLNVINSNTTFTHDAVGTVDAANKNGLTNGLGNNGAGAKDANYVRGNTDAGRIAAIIDDVDSVTVGVNNANIKVTNLTESYVDDEYYLGGSVDNNTLAFPKSEIYTLYHRDGYVVAAVTIGEDAGTSTKIAYFPNSAPTREEYVSDNTRDNGGYWTWQREAIVDGEWVTLTEKGDSLTQLSANRIGAGDVAEIRYDADGNVRKAENLTDMENAKTENNYGDIQNTGSSASNFQYLMTTGKYITDVTKLEESAEDENLVVLYANYNNISNGTVNHPTTGLSYRNGTLYTDNGNTHGFYVEGAKVIVTRAKVSRNGTPGVLADVAQFDNHTETFTGARAMESALNALDCNRDNVNFYGYIIAIAENGRVTSVILNDTYGKVVNEGTNTSGPSTGVAYDETVTNVQTLLNGGSNVTIPASWIPSDTSAGASKYVEIPAGQTLTINGNLTAGSSIDLYNTLRIGGTGNLVVNGTFVTDSNVSRNITYNVTANDMRLIVHNGDTVDINSNVTVGSTGVNGNLSISGSSTSTINIAANKTVTVNGNINNTGNTRTINVNGTLTAENYSGTAGDVINVRSTTSLHITGTARNVTINIGDASNAGYATIGTLDNADVKVIKIDSTKVPEITTVTRGTVDVQNDAKVEVAAINASASNTAEVKVTGATASATVGTVDAAATGTAKVTVSGANATAAIDTVTTGTVETDGTSAAVTIKVAEEDATLKGTQGSIEVTDTLGTVDTTGNVSAGKDVEVAIFKANSGVVFICDEESWTAAYNSLNYNDEQKKLIMGGATWEEAKSNPTFPWLFVLLNPVDTENGVWVKDVKVERDGTKVQTYAGTSEDNDWDWTSEDSSFKGGYLHWEMKKSSDTNTRTLSLGQETAAAGTYTITVTLVVGDKSAETVNTVDVPFSEPFPPPAAEPAPEA